MIQIVKKISLDTYKPNLFKIVAAKQGDSNSRFLQVTIVNEGRKIEVPSTATVTIGAKRPDGQAENFACEINPDGSIKIPLTFWMLEISGVVECDVSIVGAENTKLSTTKFFVEVEGASCPDDEISSDDNYSILVKLIEDVKALQENNAQTGISFKTDETLTLSGGILSVNTTDTVASDNTLPITSAGVAVTVGNIETILKTI